MQNGTSERVDRRVRCDLANLSSADAMNALPRLLWNWLVDEDWLAASRAMPAVERRAWLAELGAAAFDSDCGGYASFLRANTQGLDHVWSDAELAEILRRHTQSLFVNLSDVVDFRYARDGHPWDNVTVAGETHLRKALDRGRGVIALSVHQSHPGFGFMHGAWKRLGLSAVANLGDRSAPHSSLLLDGLRDRVELLPTTAAALRPMLTRLSSGGCVAIYADFLYPGTPGILSTLLGGPILIASAAVSLALRTGAAVVPVTVARKWPLDDGEVRVQFGRPLPFDDMDSKSDAARSLAALMIGIAIECMIRRDPSVWRLWATLAVRWQEAERVTA